jgi:hypothetical protein
MSEFTVTRTLKAPRKRVWQVLTSGATGGSGAAGQQDRMSGPVARQE